MSRINKSFKEMFEKYGLVLNSKYLKHIFTSDDVSREFYERIKNVKARGESEVNFVRDYLYGHSQYIDWDAYVFFTYKTLKDEIGLLRFPKIVENCRKTLKNSNYAYYEPRISEDGKNVEIVRTTARELIGMKHEQDPEERLFAWREATQNIDPISFFSDSSNAEITQYCHNPDLTKLTVRLNCIRVVELYHLLSIQEKLEFMYGKDFDRLDSLTRDATKKIRSNSQEITNFYHAIPEYLEKYPEEFDLDKIFLISAYRASEYLEKANLPQEENENYTAFFKKCIESIKKRSTKVDGIYSLSDSQNNRTVTYKELEPLLKRITSKGYYVSLQEERAIMDKIFGAEGRQRLVALKEEDHEKLKVLNLTDDQYEGLLTEPGILAFITLTDLSSKRLINKKYKNMEIPQLDLEILVNADYFTKQEVLDYCAKLDTIEPDLFVTLNEKKIIDAETKINYYVDGKIDYTYLERLTDEEQNEIKDTLTATELVDLYFHKDEDEEKEKKYNRYSKLYRNFKLKRLSKEERQLADEEILEAFGDELDDDILKALYKGRIITARTLKEWSGSNQIALMMENTEIRPEDVKEMCIDGEYDVLFDVLKNPNIPKSRKMAIFRTSFANIEYEDLDDEAKDSLYLVKDEALRLINLKDEKTSRRGQKTGIRREKGKGKRFNEYTSDPQLRWDLIDLMGDYSYEMLEQGTAIFKFPDFRGGTIVVEKMYKKDKPEYGRATKIITMPIEDFERIEKDLIVNDDMPVFMIDSHPDLQDKVRSIAHTTAWGKQFAEHFEYNIGNTRTPEEIDRIDRKIHSILNSRELR